MKQQSKKKENPHTLFWTLLKETPGYNESYKEVIKEGVVHEYSNGRTTSLSTMYVKYPEEYSRMIDAMKGDSRQRLKRYDYTRDKAAKRVIAAACKYVDSLGYRFASRQDKIEYVKRIACRAANCAYFNKIPLSKLEKVYSQFCRMNETDIAGNPELDYVIGKN
ncbi:MAG: hypothetical protein LBF62_05880 [Tannerellaceae bacterium]|nr:hypothetical protein [Tannerellaceae bacterium]